MCWLILFVLNSLLGERFVGRLEGEGEGIVGRLEGEGEEIVERLEGEGL